MGRVKLKIKRLESSSSRQVTYSKRKAGILKKAKELSILCDIDLVLLMFAPNGKPTICVGECSNIEDVVSRFSEVPPQERAKRKLESLEALKKTFKKLDHDVNIQEFLGSSSQSVEELTNHLGSLQSQVTDVHKRLSYWADPDNINSIDHIRAMEQSLTESLSRIQAQKENYAKQLVPVECSGQNEMHLPSGIGCPQGASQVPWLQSSDGQQLMLQQNPNLLTQRDVGCSTDPCYQNYPGYFSAEKQAEANEQLPEDPLHDFTQNPLRLQLGAQYPYQPYGQHLFSDTTFKPETESLHSNLDYQVNQYEASRPAYDTSFPNWGSTSGNCGVAMYDEPSFTKVPANRGDGVP